MVGAVPVIVLSLKSIDRWTVSSGASSSSLSLQKNNKILTLIRLRLTSERAQLEPLRDLQKSFDSLTPDNAGHLSQIAHRFVDSQTISKSSFYVAPKAEHVVMC